MNRTKTSRQFRIGRNSGLHDVHKLLADRSCETLEAAKTARNCGMSDVSDDFETISKALSQAASDVWRLRTEEIPYDTN